MTKRYLGNIITQNPTAPAGDLANSAAKGVWSLEEQLAYKKAGLWPVAGNFPPDVEDVFSTYLYTGNGTSQTITNGIDLDGEGGLVWVKMRGLTRDHALVDTERGVRRNLKSNTTAAEGSVSGDNVNAFYSNGFLVGPDGSVNTSSEDYASWTFRKAPKFFDVVTYTGDGTNGRQIPHNLGSNIGMVVCKSVSGISTWAVKHKDRPSDEGQLNATNAFAGYGNFPTSFAGFTDSYFTVNAGGSTNGNGYNYVAYLFAHNDGDGEFGPDGDADIIKCGSVTTSSNLGTVDLGFEPQFVLIKKSSAGGDWLIFDSMRGMVVGSGDNALKPNSSEAEGANNVIDPTATGFKFYGSDGNYIYMAIRRGTKVPESGTEVFAVDNLQNPTTVPAFQSGFPVDLALVRNVNTTYDMYVKDRLRGTLNLQTNTTAAELSFFSTADFDYMNGWYNSGTNTDFYSWMWKRAPGFFDSCCYSGNSTAGRTVSHNLTVVPEMMIVKHRNGSDNWAVYHKGLNGGTTPENYYLNLDTTAAENTQVGYWNNTAPTDVNFTLGTNPRLNDSAGTYIAHLFASLPGISKVGSYTGNGSSQTIDCGFTSGARFVIVKPTAGGNWFVFDTERGITSSSSEMLRLNGTSAESSVSNSISPNSSGFIVEPAYFNNSGDTYIFYAIA